MPRHQQQQHESLSSSPASRAKLASWIDCIVGRDWEVFWKPEGENAENKQAATRSVQVINIDDDDDDVHDSNDMSGSNNNSNNVLGEDHNNNDSDDHSGSDHASDDDDEDEPDWYEAKILSACRQQVDGSNTYFNVSFVGDDEKLYQMQLTPQTVRPSVSVWIKRARAILESNATSGSQRRASSLESWEQTLPATTSLLDDQEELVMIEQHLEKEVESRLSFKHAVISADQFHAIHRLQIVVKQQIYLFSKLVPEEKAYPEYLLECLQELESVCQWYVDGWNMLTSVYRQRENQQPQELLSIQVLDQLVQGSREAILFLERTLDTSPENMTENQNRKRKQREAMSGLHRRTKRQRYRKAVDSDNNVVCFEDADFYSASTIRTILSHVQRTDPRWFSDVFLDLLSSLHADVVTPVNDWQKRVVLYLCQKDPSDNSDVEYSDDDEELIKVAGAVESGDERQNEHVEREDVVRREYVTYDDIVDLTKSVERDEILRQFELSDTVAKLKSKMADIDEFAQRAWTCIKDLYCETAEASDPEHDSVVIELQALLALANDAHASISNVNPIESSSEALTRELLSDVLIHRRWFLDLTHATATKEQVAFIEATINQYDELPTLAESKITNLVSKQQIKLASKVQGIKARLHESQNRFDRYAMFLKNRQSRDASACLITSSSVEAALNDLTTAPYICVAQEMMCIRKDILDWKQRVYHLLYKIQSPTFDEIKRAYDELLRIRNGESTTRLNLIRCVRRSLRVDCDMREFAALDLLEFCSEVETPLVSLYETSMVWKEKASSIVNALRAHGNPLAGETNSILKSPAMVDLKRISDLIKDYDAFVVDISCLYHILVSVHKESNEWSAKVIDRITVPSPFDEMLSMLTQKGQQRPRGIIIEPTRQLTESLQELLAWHVAVKTASNSPVPGNHSPLMLAIEGIEVLEAFAERQPGSVTFKFEAKQALEYHLISEVKHQSSQRITVCKLLTNPLSKQVLQDMIDGGRDAVEGYPLLSLLHFLWCICIKSFLQKSSGSTLVEAKALLASRPTVSGRQDDLWARFATQSLLYQVDALQAQVNEGEALETLAREALSVSKGILRNCLDKPEEIRLHFSKIRELFGQFSIRSDGNGLSLAKHLEDSLAHDSKLLGWLSHALSFQVIFSRDADDKVEVQANQESNTVSGRIPWKELVSLHGSMPDSTEASGDFAYILLRVKELFESASGWDAKVSTYTRLSLGARRKHDRQGDHDEPIMVVDSPVAVDPQKIAELSDDPILFKVEMPREKGIQDVLTNTLKFEELLQTFLGSEYLGPCADSVLIPAPSSLVGPDGSIQCIRLTDNPVFDALKNAVTSIAAVADSIMADTPGKDTFDWIRFAINWIERLRGAFVYSESNGRPRLPDDVANRLWDQGKQVLFNVSEDLRWTLNKHGLTMSISQEGQMVVNWTKDAAQFALGTQVLQWCPFLLHSLQNDIEKSSQWRKDLSGVTAAVSAAYSEFNSKRLSPSDPICILEYLRLRDLLDDLSVKVEDLVIFPDAPFRTMCFESLNNINNYLSNHVTREALQKHAEITYAGPTRLVEDRFKQLDSLVHRMSLDHEGGDLPEEIMDMDSVHFRTTLRILFDKAFQKTCESMDITLTEESTTYCALKAWEMEQALFVLYPCNASSDPAFAKYRDQGRALKRGLEDPDNLSLCIRVLTGERDMNTLVRMSTEELASAKLREERAKAEAMHSSVLVDGPNSSQPHATPSGTTQAGSRDEQNNPSNKAPPATTATPQSSAVGIPVVVTSKSASSAAATPLISSATPASASPPVAARETAGTNLSLRQLVKKASTYRPPPPPPSLANLSVGAPTRPQSPPQLQLVTSNTGTSHFEIEVAGRSRRFTAELVLERSPNTTSNHTALLHSMSELLSPNLIEVARVSISEFKKFLDGKLASGRNQLCLLRVQCCTLRDEQECKKFSKTYEDKDRIAMFSLTDNTTKLYLVTPKFHGIAKKYVRLNQANSLYAVVIIKS